MIFNSLYSLVLRDNWRYSFKKFGCSPCLCAETPFLRFYFLPFFFFKSYLRAPYTPPYAAVYGSG